MWSQSVHCHLYVEKELAADVALKNGQYRYWPVKEEFHFYYYAVTLSDGVTRLSLNLTILPILLGKMTLFDRHQAYACFVFCLRQENYHDTRS